MRVSISGKSWLGLKGSLFDRSEGATRRRVKCDEVRPTCLLCKTSGLACGGYGKNIFFTSGDDGALVRDGIRFRRLLFTEAERKAMSQWLMSSVPPTLVSRQLSRLDEHCENAAPYDSIELHSGPFGVFRDRPALETGPELPQSGFELDWSNDLDYCPEMENNPACRPPKESTHQLSTIQQWHDPYLATMLNGSLQDMLPDASDICSILDVNDLGTTLRNLSEGNSGMQEPELSLAAPRQEASNGPDTVLQNIFPASIIDLCRISQTATSHPSTLAYAPMPVPGDAVFLLKHYSSTVVNFISPFGHAKTPWHILFIPHVKSCLAALTMGENLCHASLTIFFGTLAVSASSLEETKQSHSMWKERAKMYERQARKHCHAALETAYRVPKAAKYKTILMALLTVIHMYTVFGSQDRVDFYFIETEKFIRVKGLNRQKSRKVRMLHHCYAFQRIFYESLCINDNNNFSHRDAVQRAIASSNLAMYSKDSVSFHISRWRNLSQELCKSKTQEEGENDLHLERPGVWPATLYPEIYGVPEVLMCLLSCIVQLGKEKDAIGQNGSSITSFLDRAKILERCIERYQRQDNTSAMCLPDSNADELDKLAKITNAVQNALAIYFYRRIYDVNASLLQHMVASVLDSLIRSQRTGTGDACGSLGLVWPAFIAACEAEDATIRKAFTEWFETCTRSSGFKTFSTTAKTIAEVWRIKSSLNSESSWIDLLRAGPQLPGWPEMPMTAE
ncbi:uncharacterized protein JN550_002118 [Neoarthrinium moseri]|uniref:uncharacterized protein n=1 Tax=Neoarthrinium moseri TaxID=1658444 RepID=UPI001FDC694B|nr:uncharacterized protein JN550_002118 [Neoarthrinium moseri]KAI1875832.1 hypothetical protein JN550_002118 [Neoarthrinium moseri]